MEQGAPERNVVWHAGRITDSAEEDGVKRLEDLNPIIGKHAAMRFIVVARCKVKVLELKLEAKALGRSFESLEAFRHD